MRENGLQQADVSFCEELLFQGVDKYPVWPFSIFFPVCRVVSKRIDHFYFSMQYFDNKLLNSVYWTTQTKPLLSWLTLIAYLVGEIKSDVGKKF